MRWTIGAVLLACLGCSGISESLVELSTGMDIEVQEDGTTVITAADGTKQTIRQGGDATLPEGFPVPPPGDDPLLESVMLGGEQTTAVWRLAATDDLDAIVAAYQAWFVDERGVEVRRDDQNLMGMRTTALVATVDGKLITVVATDALGSRLITATVQPAP